MEIAEAFVTIRGKYDGFHKQVATEGEKAGKSLASTMSKAFAAASIGIGLKKSIDAASNLNETVSKSQNIFGAASAAMEKTAATAARSMGLSKQAYLDAASGLKGLLDNLGLAQDQSVKWSKTLTQLGSDLASFFNTDPADAIDAIQSALRGEQEPIRRYNVNISEAAVQTEAFKLGLYSGKGAIDANAKAQATLALIMQQTSAAQGDFARTAGGVANSQRIAAAEGQNAAASLGGALLPVYKELVQVVTRGVEVFTSLPKPVQTGIVALAGLVALSGPIAKVGEVAESVGKGLIEMGKGALGAAPALVGLVGVIGLAVAAYAIYSDNKHKAAAVTNEFVTALQAEAKGQTDATNAAILHELSQHNTIALAKQAGISVADLGNVIRGNAVGSYQALDDAVAGYMRSGMAAEQINAALLKTFGLSYVDAVSLVRAVNNLKEGWARAQTQASDLDTAAQALAGTTAKNTDQTDELRAKQLEQLNATEKLKAMYLAWNAAGREGVAVSKDQASASPTPPRRSPTPPQRRRPSSTPSASCTARSCPRSTPSGPTRSSSATRPLR